MSACIVESSKSALWSFVCSLEQTCTSVVERNVTLAVSGCGFILNISVSCPDQIAREETFMWKSSL